MHTLFLELLTVILFLIVKYKVDGEFEKQDPGK